MQARASRPAGGGGEARRRGAQWLVDSTSTVRGRIEFVTGREPSCQGCRRRVAFELLITERRSASEDLCGVDVRLDPGSLGLLAQQLVSLRKVVALLDQHPDGAVQHRLFGESGQPGHAGEWWKIGVKLNCFSLTVHMDPSLINAIHGRRCLVNGNAPEGVAHVGGEIGESARGAGEEDDSAFPIDPRNQRKRETQRCTDRCVVTVSEGGQRDRPLVLDNCQLESAVGGGRRAQCRGQCRQRVIEILIIFADADREILKVREYGCWEIHTRAPRKRIRPLVVPA